MKKFLWLSVALLMMGCATQQKSALTERDKILLEGRMDDLEAAEIRQKTKIASLEKRVAQLEDMVSMLSRRTSMEAREVVKIEPESPQVSAQFDYRGAAPENDDVYEDIVISEEKKRAYFGRQAAPSYGSYGSTTPTSVAGGTNRTLKPYDNVTDEKLPSPGDIQNGSPSNIAPASPMTLYQEGIDLYRQGNFADARAKFETFLATKPDESYVDNALYWIGECFYGEGLYHEAAGYFHRIVQEYPKANKVPDALLKVSLTYQKLGKIDSAREMLRYLMEAFPGTEAARTGKEKYEAMSSAQ